MSVIHEESNREARFWEKQTGDKVKCLLCPHYCRITEGHSGRCLARLNKKGVLFAAAYGKITSFALDPIEKKPLYYFQPGSKVLSIGSYGCNLSCSFCQNWSIASRKADYEFMEPDKLVRLAMEYKSEGSIGVAYTYNEPFINWEYIYESSRLIKAIKQYNILVTNGYINPEPLEEILPYIDAMNIDLKSFSEAFYQETCRGSLAPVLNTIAISAGKCHVEVTTLLIPGQNDSDEEIDKLSAWLADIDPTIPLHLTRHHPAYKMIQPELIKIDRMYYLADIAQKHLSRVKLGNIGY